jgi:hypothetical protein
MPSVRETALNALFGALATMPGATVERNSVVPERVPAGGLIILRDGSRSEVDLTISPRTWHWQHDAVVEVMVQDASSAGRAASLDDILLALEAVLEADRHLGGAVDWTEVTNLVTDDIAIPAGAALKGAVVTVSLLYDTSSVLG